MADTLRRRRASGDQDGAVVVEFAIVFVLFVTLLAGLIQYGAIFAVQQSISHAAAEATRSAVDVVDDTQAQARAQQVLDDHLAWLDAAGVTATPAVGACPATYTTATTCLVVDVAYDWAGHPVVPAMLAVPTPDSLTARAVIVRD